VLFRSQGTLLIAEGPHGHGQELVTAIDAQDMVCRHAVDLGRGCSELVTDGVRIAAELIGLDGGQGLEHLWGRRIGILIGVELDHVRLLGLEPRDVPGGLFYIWPKKTHIDSKAIWRLDYTDFG
jgi:hypothetical protein